jgi:hypothetical protein
MSAVGADDLVRPDLKECIEAPDIAALCWRRRWMPAGAQYVGTEKHAMLAYRALSTNIRGDSSTDTDDRFRRYLMSRLAAKVFFNRETEQVGQQSRFRQIKPPSARRQALANSFLTRFDRLRRWCMVTEITFSRDPRASPKMDFRISRTSFRL